MLEIVLSSQPTADDLLEVLRKLRSPEGCPWDREQTRSTLCRCLEEESAELVDAIDQNDVPEICEELGDVLINLMMQALVAQEQNEFSFDDVVNTVYQKMIRRHPHVFGGDQLEKSSEVLDLWQKIKASEPEKQKRESILDGIPNSLPALLQADKMQRKASKCGFDWTEITQIIAKIREELVEVEQAIASQDSAHTAEEIGDLLFAVTNLARFQDFNPEQLLRDANRKFSRRFRYIEQQIKQKNQNWNELSLEQLDQIWDEAKSNNL